MPKRLTYEFVKKEFEKEGYILISKEYKNSRQKLKCICSKGHKHVITWPVWQQGHRCRFCCKYQNRYTIEDIKKEFEKEGYELLTKIYKNNKQKLKYICPNGHKHFITWDRWQRGGRCGYCYGKFKLDIKFIKSEFKKENYILLTKKYRNAHQKLNYICPNKHNHSIRWANWQQGARCSYCVGQGKPTIEFIKEEFKKEKYKLLTETYKNNTQKLNYICPNEHKHSITWRAWQQGKRCQICYFNSNYGRGNPNWRGGISCEPYCFEWSSKEFKDFIKERDGNRCLNPDCWGNVYELSVHHINYNKKDCVPKNLATLCRSCNSRANKDREWHEDWYKAIMYMRGYV